MQGCSEAGFRMGFSLWFSGFVLVFPIVFLGAGGRGKCSCCFSTFFCFSGWLHCFKSKSGEGEGRAVLFLQENFLSCVFLGSSDVYGLSDMYVCFCFFLGYTGQLE